MKTITSECVSYGHPDKLADQISDAILDELREYDPLVKAGIEVMIKDNIVVLGGEISVRADVVINYDEIIKRVIANAGYTSANGLSPDNIKVINLLGKQSIEINKAVTQYATGAGDQGIMFGYATNETPTYMPLDVYIARMALDATLKIAGLGPDAKSQVTITEQLDGTKSIDNILVSVMHTPSMSVYEVRNKVNIAVREMLQSINRTDDRIIININPAGSWNIGGPISDCGLTGRKIVVDQYGANCEVGGGAYSGKDFSKPDRSASYYARYMAKNIVAAGIVNECKVQLSYVIGEANPSSVYISGKINGAHVVLSDEQVSKILSTFPLTMDDIIGKLDRCGTRLYDTAFYGHFGITKRLNYTYPWEMLDKVDELNSAFNK